MDLGSSFTLVHSITPARPWSNKAEKRSALSENKLSLKSKKNKNIGLKPEEQKYPVTLEKYFSIKKLVSIKSENKENNQSSQCLMNFVNEDIRKDREVLRIKNYPVSVDNKYYKTLESDENSKECVSSNIKSANSNIFERISSGSSKDIFSSFVDNTKLYNTCESLEYCSINEVKRTSVCEVEKTYRSSVSSGDIRICVDVKNKCSPNIRRNVKRRFSRRSSLSGDENDKEPLLRTTRGRGAKTTISESLTSLDDSVVNNATDIPIRPVQKNSIEITETGITRLSESSKKLSPSSISNDCDGKPSKKLKSCFEKELSLSEKFDIKSSIKSVPRSSQKFISKSEKKAPILKEVNKSENSKILISPENKVKSKKLFSDKKKCSVSKAYSNNKGEINEANIEKLNEAIASNKIHKRKSCNFERRSSLSSVCPSTLPINKFEEINNWLSDTHDKTIIISDSDSEVSKTPSLTKKSRKSDKKLNVSIPVTVKAEGDKKLIQSEHSIKGRSLSFNISGKEKNKQDDEIITISSDVGSPSRYPVTLSENVLNRLYGVEYEELKDEIFEEPQSEPKRKPTKDTVIRRAPRSETKNRTSTFDIFSPSSEDSFEEFLDNVQHGKFKSVRHPGKRLYADDFINDSSCDEEPSFTLYRRLVVEDIRNDVKSLTPKNHDLTAVNNIRPKLGRRLSFSSTKSDGQVSEHSALSDNKPESVNKKERNSDNESDKIKASVKKKNADVAENKIINTNNNKDSVKKLVSSTEKKKRGILRTPKVTGKVQTPVSKKKIQTPNACYVPTLSFLSSLSEMTGDLPCHPEAERYKKNYKKLKEELAFKLFDLYNKEVFENKLPSNMLIQWNGRMTSTSGFCYNKREFRVKEVVHSSRVVLASKILDRPDRLRDTLIHELCHAATWIVDKASDGHGPLWKAWANKANHTFPELPRIKRCHNYAITTKYTYKCLTCGYSIGRHSKSLDVERKRCGFCLGKFELLVTRKQGGGASSITSGSDSVRSSRKPTGFALFVKEHYSTVKKTNSKITHSEVMKVLAQKFAQVKISKQSGNATD